MMYPDWSKSENILDGPGSYEIKKNGYVLVMSYGNDNSSYVRLNGFLVSNCNSHGHSDAEYNFIPVKKGDILTTFKDSGRGKSGAQFLPFRR